MIDARLARLYVFAVALLVFFVTWAVVAARPWAPAPRRASAVQDPRVAALVVREKRIRAEVLLVRKLRAQRTQQIGAAPAPAPRIVNLPPLVITRTS